MAKKVTVRYVEGSAQSARINLDIYAESDPAISTSEDESSPNRGSCYSDAVKRNTQVSNHGRQDIIPKNFS